jgi:uncharacterized protein involved in exopolysaccharide biosynthesis
VQTTAPYLQPDQPVTRRAPDVEDIINMIKGNKGWLAGPALAGLVIAVVVAFLWPNTYMSTAVVRVVPPQVPEKLVPSNVHMAMTHRIGAMTQTITSRATLTSIIETHGLYPSLRNSMPMEDIADRMRSAIRVGEVRSVPGRDNRRSSKGSGGGDMSAFQVTFSYENRFLAQKVAQDLANRFIAENSRTRTYQSAMTTQFLKEQWLSAKAEVNKYEQQLTAFRARNAGRLPEQFNSTLQKATAWENRINTLNNNITRNEQEKMVIQSEMRLQRDRIDAIMNTKPDPAKRVDPRAAAWDERIQKAEGELLRLLETYKPNHPDVLRQKGQIELLRKGKEEYLASSTQPAGSEPAAQLTPEQSREVRDLNAKLGSAEIKLKALDMQTAQHNKEIENANLRIKEVHAQMMAQPANDQEYTALMRDYDLAKVRYNDFNKKMEQSGLATDLEARQQGETLEMLDQATLPDAPAEPDRPMIIAIGLIAGLAIGGTLVSGKELKDKTIKTLKDVRAYTRLTILGSVPLLQNELVVGRRRRARWLAWSAACLVSLLVMGGAVYYYLATKV